MNPVIIISADDWQAIYLNGKCFDQHHSVTFLELIKCYRKLARDLGVLSAEDLDYTAFLLSKEGQGWLDLRGSFPELLKDVPGEFLV